MSEEYSFVNEKIKQQPFYKKKAFKWIGITTGLAVLFGTVSCLVFGMLYPVFFKETNPNKIESIKIPEDNPKDQESMSQESDTTADTMISNDQITVLDYEKLYGEFQKIAKETERSLVKVTAVNNGIDWFDQTYENHGQSTGIIIGSNGVELLILTDYTSLEFSDGIRVEFCDGKKLTATIKKYDRITDQVILSVNLSEISETTTERIAICSLGNSYEITAGTPVIAIGMADGIYGSRKVGTITSVGSTVSMMDGETRLLVSDMVRNEGAGGVLINLQGEVVGILQNTYEAESMKGMLTAYPISEMKGLIEKLSNNQDLVYLGVYGVTVNEKLAGMESIPEGIYVTKVVMDSPAMQGGIQAGDIIQKINGQNLSTMDQLSEILKKMANKQKITLEGMRLTKDGYKKVTYETEVEILE